MVVNTLGAGAIITDVYPIRNRSGTHIAYSPSLGTYFEIQGQGVDSHLIRAGAENIVNENELNRAQPAILSPCIIGEHRSDSLYRGHLLTPTKIGSKLLVPGLIVPDLKLVQKDSDTKPTTYHLASNYLAPSELYFKGIVATSGGPITDNPESRYIGEVTKSANGNPLEVKIRSSSEDHPALFDYNSKSLEEITEMIEQGVKFWWDLEVL